MSDGNYNRALLPSTPYTSALKAGRAQARQWAAEAFQQWLRTQDPAIDEATLKSHTEAFAALLSAKAKLFS